MKSQTRKHHRIEEEVSLVVVRYRYGTGTDDEAKDEARAKIEIRSKCIHIGLLGL